jgi:membrane protease YdiL (CAAX protease family)
MIDALDVWDLGHAFLGFSMGVLGLKRWFAYPLKLVWELYQLFVYYPPQGLGFEDIWVNSVLDMLAFAVVYEISFLYAPKIARKEWWRRISPQTKGVTAFLFILYGGSFIMGYELEPSAAPSLLQISTVVFPLVLCPAISAFMVRGLVTKEGFADVGFAMNFKKKWPYFIGAGILPALITIISGAFLPVTHYVLPEWLQLTVQGSLSGNWDSLLLSQLAFAAQLVILTAIMTPIMFGQEFGWRGYLQPRLFGRNPLLSAVATGLIWGLWLSSVTWRAYRLSGPAASGLLVFPFACVCLSIILAWFRSRTGSIWATSMLHGAIATAGGSFIVAPIYLKSEVVTVSSLGVWSLIPLAGISFWILVNEWRQNRPRDAKF